LHPRTFADSWFFRQAAQVSWVAGEHHDRPGLVKRDHGEKRVERAPVTRQTAPAEQLPGRTALLLVNRDYGDPAEGAVYASIPGTATQDLGESGRGGDDSALPVASGLDQSKDGRMVGGQLGQALSVENEGAAYSSS
jgi:hypothetical protein